MASWNLNAGVQPLPQNPAMLALQQYQLFLADWKRESPKAMRRRLGNDFAIVGWQFGSVALAGQEILSTECLCTWARLYMGSLQTHEMHGRASVDVLHTIRLRGNTDDRRHVRRLRDRSDTSVLHEDCWNKAQVVRVPFQPIRRRRITALGTTRRPCPATWITNLSFTLDGEISNTQFSPSAVASTYGFQYNVNSCDFEATRIRRRTFVVDQCNLHGFSFASEHDFIFGIAEQSFTEQPDHGILVIQYDPERNLKGGVSTSGSTNPATTSVTSALGSHSASHTTIVAGAAAGGSVAVFLVLVGVLIYIRRKKRAQPVPTTNILRKSRYDNTVDDGDGDGDDSSAQPLGQDNSPEGPGQTGGRPPRQSRPLMFTRTTRWQHGIPFCRGRRAVWV
ncbi:uncharacterized protein B0H18DRAFT_1143755 [Fomitopsis serialis]|uniref:uncharacterized protein n=1 Tax=Fomitopsis serialis TaxID=139415 RepID=UPI002007EC8D|nr:uncharacterized protein B0H18DRAFT_1143755 [Neoantrodia serialis]KAH9930987.1 hypothetical protein B0H18DRAFT_1143755 [Neoantrodia serialis]